MSGEGHPQMDLAMQSLSAHPQDVTVRVSNVRDALKQLSLSSTPGPDGITGNHLKFAHETLHVHLSLIFKLFFKHSYIPEILTNIRIRNLLKDQQKSLSDMSNYRPIALASLISKLFECIILQRCEHLLVTSDNQFAYKSNHSTDMALFLLKQSIELYK